jgi:bacterioferritin-associated ferredoxin
MYLCICCGVTEQDLIDKVTRSESPFHYAGLSLVLKANKLCCKCLPRTREVIDEAIKQKAIRNSSTSTS